MRTALIGLVFTAALAAGTVAQTPPVELTAQQDHARLMALLKISSIRQGANGNDPNAANAANYDEAKANPYPHLPDPLLTMDRQRVTSAELWHSKRRPEIVELFDREIYGRVPANVPAVKWEVTGTTRDSVGGIPVVTQQLIGRVDNSAYPLVTVEIQASLTMPANARGRIPIITQFGWFVPRPSAAPPTAGLVNWRELVIKRGWGYASINPNSIQRDHGAGLTTGIIGLVNRGHPRGVEDWGALRAWAWGASRFLDYLETHPLADAKRVTIEGHSRYGKAALVTMAYDQRFAAGYISSSGQGGAKLHRRNAGEIVENVAGSGEYHWMAGNYIKYAGPLTWDDLPVDSHQLIALAAPRPLLISAGDRGDAWVDSRGSFMAAVAASPVYELLGARGLRTDQYPPLETGLLEGELAFRQHAAGHTDGPNWPIFLDLVARYFR